MSEETKKVKLYSYTKVWKLEKKIYSIQNVVLPVPVNPYNVLSFLVTAGVMILLVKLIPGLTGLPTVIRYFVIPFLISNYLMKKKLDGMNPIKYFAGIIVHFLKERNNYIEAFKEHPQKEEVIKLTWDCSKAYKK